MNKLRAIVFDAYGTLFDVQSINDKLAQHFGENATTIGAIWRQKQLEYTWLRGLMNRYKHFDQVTGDALEFSCEKSGVLLKAEIKADLMDAYNELSIFPDVESTLMNLQKSYQLAILSNANKRLLTAATKFNQIQDYFSEILSVEEIGTFKTDPRVYELATKKLGLAADEIVFVSSNTWDVAGAKSFGLKVIWMKRNNAIVEKLDFLPDFQINSLNDIQDLLL